MFLHHLLSCPSFFFLCVCLVSLNPHSTSLSNDCINTSKCTFCFTTLATMVGHLRHIAHYGTQCVQQFSLHACLQYHKVHMYLEMQNKLWKIKSVDVSYNVNTTGLLSGMWRSWTNFPIAPVAIWVGILFIVLYYHYKMLHWWLPGWHLGKSQYTVLCHVYLGGGWWMVQNNVCMLQS